MKGLHVNVGCGEFYADGWVNIDSDDSQGFALDVVAEVTDLPFEAGEVDLLYAGHVLEHLEYEQVPAALDEFARVLGEDGVLCVVGPDYVRAVEKRFGKGVRRDIIEGPDYSPHRWVCTEAAVVLLLEAACWEGVGAVEIEELGGVWPVVSRIGWQCAVTARPPRAVEE